MFRLVLSKPVVMLIYFDCIIKGGKFIVEEVVNNMYEQNLEELEDYFKQNSYIVIVYVESSCVINHDFHLSKVVIVNVTNCKEKLSYIGNDNNYHLVGDLADHFIGVVELVNVDQIDY